MNFTRKVSSSYKHNSMLIKLGVSVLILGLACRALFYGASPVVQTPILQQDALVSERTSMPEQEFHVTDRPPLSVNDRRPEQSPSPFEASGSSDKCNVFAGDWIPKPSGPGYTNESCHLIESHQNCMTNGRPDSEFLYWRWKPKDCELPAFDAEKFLKLMKNKAWALIGDSISRNHVQSLLCLLSKVENPVEAYHDEEYRSKRWHFPVHNFTVSVIWSPLLVKAAIFENFDGISTSEIQLHLDKLDGTWTDQYSNSDYIIISTGKWFLKNAIYYEGGEIMGCHNCKGNNYTDLGFDYAYRKALQSVFSFIRSSNHRGIIFFRTSSPDHFENGEWSSGGTCTRTKPVKEGEIKLKDLNRILLDIELEEFAKATGSVSTNGTDLRLLDFTHLLLTRPDGHPGPYRQFYPFAKDRNAKVQNDCLHWCLPGPIDAWNDLIMEIIING